METKQYVGDLADQLHVENMWLRRIIELAFVEMDGWRREIHAIAVGLEESDDVIEVVEALKGLPDAKRDKLEDIFGRALSCGMDEKLSNIATKIKARQLGINSELAAMSTARKARD
jgi:hypothetical protein